MRFLFELISRNAQLINSIKRALPILALLQHFDTFRLLNYWQYRDIKPKSIRLPIIQLLNYVLYAGIILKNI